MMKVDRWPKISILLLLGFSLVLTTIGCGVKAPPVPPRSIPPAAITTLTYTIEENQVTLSWPIPTGEAAGSAGLAGFLIYRAVTSLTDSACDGCPALFRRVADVDLEGLMAGNPGRKSASFRQSFEKGFQYIFKVTAYARDGQRSPDSNRVVVR